MIKPQIEPEQANGTKVDWSEVNRKINSLQESLNQSNILSPEEKRSVLKARAKSLAAETKDDSAPKEILKIVEFSLASEVYGIESRFVREVYPLKEFTTLPGIPSFVLGIINVRGQIVSVIDLKKFFNLPEKGIGELNKVIILHNERMEFGILTDSILGTHLIPVNDLQISPVSTNGIGAGYLRGITKDHSIILDGERILDDENIIVHQKAE